ncbi:hypothetical protein QNH20_18395 [Neobacillus sp. WH10]|nr:hypothetical protein [Neobacillus sp. WH10]WHY76083.1 hypothetical protein QNH20_18395 [Neobacillus sp. WH10]
MSKLDPVERQTILFELEMKTNISPDYLNNLSSEKLIELYKERCQNGKS